MERVMAIHVAEEARHISFAHEYLHKRVPICRAASGSCCRCVPIMMRVLCLGDHGAAARFWRFDIPRSVRKDVFFKSPSSRQLVRTCSPTFGCCADTGLMNPAAKIIWRICKIDGPRRYRSEPQRQRRQRRLRRRARQMPHVITQSCCSDGSCVYACPVNCIHPSPDEPGFATAEMLYIDPVACVDCGACVSACPVGAIAPETS
jgi:NAD-dependent dihydropyrimidine dehydrogenase PreA subunit